MKPNSDKRNILISFDISSIAGRDQLSGVLKYLRKKPNWVPRLITQSRDLTPELIHDATREKIDGIIVNHAGSDETEDELFRSSIPLAVVGIRNEHLSKRTRAVAFIRNDNDEIGRLAARHFLSLGNFRSYGFIPARPATEDWSLRRYRGFRSILARRGIDVDLFTHASCSGTEEYSRALGLWLGQLPKPAAVLAAWDSPALQAVETCRALRLNVPHSVAILGVDNDPLICDATNPALSSIPFDYEKQGYESASALETIMTRPKVTSRPLVIVCHPLPVCTRESTVAISPATALIKQARRFIEKNATRGISAKDVARDLGISHSLLTLRFREFSDTTVSNAISEARLKCVRRLLRETNRTIGDISTAAGFRNVNYLKNLFKKRFGMTMRDYRVGN